MKITVATKQVIKCNFCSNRLEDIYVPKGWDWFTGYLTETVHVCPKCQKSHAKEAALLFAKSRNEKPPSIA